MCSYFQDPFDIPDWNQVEASTQLGELQTTTHAGDRPAKQRRQDINVATTVSASAINMTSRVARLSPISTFRWRRRPEVPRCSRNGSARQRAQPVHRPPILVPEEFPTIFRPTPEMALNLAECKLAAYIFGHFDRIGEILFKNGTFNMTRIAFYSICPREQLNTEVVRAMSLIATDAERKRETVKAWFLPCSFATQVWAGAPISELDIAYGHPFMPATKTLRHISMPVAEADGTYYLVLIDLKDCAVYSMDVCTTEETKAQRGAVIEKLEYEKTIRMRSAIKLLRSTLNELFPMMEERIET
ncbi:hypothetical protein PIB30_024918 [Stylosanthes scabra]|uniref:Uncharacterized protein n=1 Tax=Stylosanthes scabra TaxID=79078 RepID=A0ABU6TA63_9FABA|nr:hypothetical protein [Stylosanthes scabra]